jgi:hypothetical protein
MIAGRALNTTGVAMIAIAVAIAASVLLSVLTRTTGGIAVAAAMVVVGDLIARRGEQSERGQNSRRNGPGRSLLASRAYWTGTTTMATGYALAAFFAHASHYVSSVSGFQSAFPCWFLELALAAVATIHGSRNKILRFATVPFTLLASANVLYHALTSTDTVTILGLTTGVSAVASVVSVLWFAALTALHQKLEAASIGSNGEGTGPAGDTTSGAGNGRAESGHSNSHAANLLEHASRLMHRAAHEGYFVLAAVSALALPKFCGSIEYAPLWWAIETPALLAISWRSKSFIKHALVMGIWALSAVLLLGTKMDLSPVVRMAIPVSGIIMALTYRYIHSTWAHWQKKVGYSVYLYGSVGVAVALPLFQMTPLEALPYWLAQSGVVLVMALALKDKVLQRAGAIAGVGTLALFGSQWQNWEWPMVIEVIAGCYAMSLVYGWVEKRGGLANSEFVPLPGKFTLTKKEADWMEKGAGILGYATLIASSFLLIATPYNTVAWGAEAFSLIAFGFVTRKVGHRASGLLAMALASAKLTIFDLSGAGTLLRSLVSFGAISVCCFAAGMFYMIEYGRLQKRIDTSDDKDDEQPPEKKD